MPLEAMAAGRPVIAVDSGGPRESVEDGVSGWLCEPTPDAFADAFGEVAALHSQGRLKEYGVAARTRVEACFSLDVFGSKLEDHLKDVLAVGKGKAA